MSNKQEVSLTAKQQEIVHTKISRLVIEAQPGSGKTRILVERLVAGLQKDGFKPAQVVAITFTEKAAQEIKDRVGVRIQGLGSPTLPQQVPQHLVDQLWISTIHGFCFRVLREHAWEANLSTTFSVLSSEQAIFLKNKVFQELFQKLLQEKDNALSFLLAQYGFYKLKSLVKVLYEKRFQLKYVPKGHWVNDPRVSDPSSSAEVLQALLSVFQKIELEYQFQKKQRNVCDFDDLLWSCLELLQTHPSILNRYRQQFKLILVDEFQDTNDVQRWIIDLLTQAPQGPCLMVVGDPKQSIYRFRGADVSLFYEVKADILEHQGFCFELLENFRSHKTLIEFTNALFKPLLGETFIPSEPARMEPNAPRVVDPTPSVEYWTRKEEEGEGLSSEEARKKEAAWLADHLKKYKGKPWSNIAILFRAMTFSPIYERALDSVQIPWVRTDGGAFYQSREVAELLALLKWAINPQDEFSLWTVLSAPWSGISSKTLVSLAAARAEHRSSLESLLKQFKKLKPFIFALQKLVWLKERVSLEEWYLKMVPDTIQVRRFLKLIREFEKQNPDFQWSEFVHYLEALQEEDVSASEPLPLLEDTPEEGVWLLTVHKAKGLEFDTVCIPDLGYLPRKDSPLLLIDKKIGIGLKEDSLYAEIKKKERECEVEESKRLFYVAVTRAKNKLILSTGSSKARAGSWASFIEVSKPLLKSVMQEGHFL